MTPPRRAFPPAARRSRSRSLAPRSPKSLLTLQRPGRPPLPVPSPDVIVDTREQEGYTFTGYHRIGAVHRLALETGDYALAAHPDLIRIERKTLGDLYSSLSPAGRRPAFLQMAARLAHYPARYLIVEASLVDILTYRAPTPEVGPTYHPHAVLGTLDALFLKYGIPTLFAHNRDEAEARVANLLAMAHAYWYAESLGLDRTLITGDL